MESLPSGCFYVVTCVVFPSVQECVCLMDLYPAFLYKANSRQLTTYLKTFNYLLAIETYELGNVHIRAHL